MQSAVRCERNLKHERIPRRVGKEGGPLERAILLSSTDSSVMALCRTSRPAVVGQRSRLLAARYLEPAISHIMRSRFEFALSLLTRENGGALGGCCTRGKICGGVMSTSHCLQVVDGGSYSGRDNAPQSAIRHRRRKPQAACPVRPIPPPVPACNLLEAPHAPNMSGQTLNAR